ncbi:MAG: gamma-glutamyltransferase [Gammaproteobacteria bacterium]|nr:gamma-glutamyltransferase [Gammaproteobacteria bacterium]
MIKDTLVMNVIDIIMKKTHQSFRIVLSIVFTLSAFAAHSASLSQAGVASAHPLATEIGENILKNGGNAMDAAIAISAALAVVEPYGSGLGGGGFWLVHNAIDGKDMMIDGRERAPLAARRDMYLDEKANVDHKKSMDGALSAGIPGVPAALQYMAETYGLLDLSTSLEPAILLARDGFKVDAYFAKMVKFRLQALQASEQAAKLFLNNNAVPEVGHVIKQEDLANTLELIANKGMEGFYQGELADKLVEGVKQAGGIWTHEDLMQYQVVPREPVVSRYKGMKVTSAALPSSGGIVMAEVFNMLSSKNIESLTRSEQIHLIVEAMRRAYRDRAQYLGDSDYVEVPVKKLISQSYADTLAASIDTKQATDSLSLKAVAFESGGNNTTHFSVIDQRGNRVSATLSVNYPFGSGYIVPGTGILLNDEMDDFSAKPGVPNAYGLVGAEANAIAPGKRMLSSMSPTFLETQDRIAVVGTPGGSRIISMVILAALEFFKGADAKAMVSLPRIHHQYLPDKIYYETAAITEESIEVLERMGHQLTEADSWGNMHVVIWDKKKKTIDAASDHRGIGKAVIIK